jgi:formylglycine-generating enzyme required for sulfatase activity
MGTLDYMAPEQALDTKRADARADIYSLGCTLYYLLTGQVVYPEDTLTKKIFAHAQQPIPDLQTLCPEVPEAVATLCRRMLAKKPEDRPQSMAEVLTALSACPVTAGLAGRPDRSAPEDRPAPLAAPTGETANLRRADVETSRESHPATSFSPTLMREPVPLPWLRARQRPLFPSWFGSPLDRRWRIGLSVAVGTMSLLLLVWAVIMLRTKAGTLVVELSDPDVVVQVFSAEGRLEIERPGAREPLTISIVPGPYQLRIKQDDLVVFAQEFTLASGSRQLIQARWEAAPIVATPTTAVPESAPVPETPAASQLPQQAVTTAATPALAPAPAPAIVATDAGRPAPATNPFDAAKAAELQAAWAMYLTTPVTITNSIGMRMQLVPPGEFTMGSGTSERDRGTDEYAHQVRILQPYFAGIFEVTQDEYERVMRDKPSWFAATGGGATQVAGRDTSRFPVEMVSWNDATEFCRQLSGLPEERAAGRTYRLPTEAEWEFACRAGTESAFHFGLQPAHHGANIGFRSNRTNGVGGAAANAFGLHDMHGNVWEWCQDWYKGDYYQTSPRDDPQGPTQGTTRVRRGGSWDCFTGLCRSAYRGGSSPTSRVSNLGFRVVFTAGP